jgi:hypothetical protein
MKKNKIFKKKKFLQKLRKVKKMAKKTFGFCYRGLWLQKKCTKMVKNLKSWKSSKKFSRSHSMISSKIILKFN